MRVTLITPPAIEPVTLDEMKLHLRQDHDDDDALITALITAARLNAEHHIRRALITQSIELALPSFPGASAAGYLNRTIRQGGWGPGYLPGAAADPIKLPRPPLLSVESLEYLDQAGAWQTLDPSLYEVSKTEPGKVAPVRGNAWPTVGTGLEVVRVNYTAGYGATAADVPEVVKIAIKLWVTFLYENRGEESAEPPMAVNTLLSAEDYGRYA